MTTPATPLVEICVPDVEGALIAEAAGADRVELCADLGQGGTTPSLGAVAVALTRLTKVGIRIMIRPRGGDFVWDDVAREVALADIAAIRRLRNPHGLDLGFVTGALTPGGALDADTMRSLIKAASPHEVTLHKAFDKLADLHRGVEEAVELGFARVLTSGGAATALDGAAMLADLRRHAADRLQILAGGGIRPGNVGELMTLSGVDEVHLRAPRQQHGTESTDAQLIRNLLTAVGR